MPDVSIEMGNERVFSDSDLFRTVFFGSIFGFKRVEVKSNHTYTATAAVAKGRAIIVLIVIVVMSVGCLLNWTGLLTAVCCVAARHRCKYHQVNSPY